jgi:MYXO-CTERM domain-containing protein
MAGGPHIGGVTTCNCEAAEGPGSAGLALMLAALYWAARRRRVAAERAPRP